MNKLKFDHFAIFQVVFKVIYILSGFLIFGILISNATSSWNSDKVNHEKVIEHPFVQIDCMNCDEID
jgi:hypothetical protein